MAKTNSSGAILTEAKYINSSLFFLEMVIVALYEKATKGIYTVYIYIYIYIYTCVCIFMYILYFITAYSSNIKYIQHL